MAIPVYTTVVNGFLAWAISESPEKDAFLQQVRDLVSGLSPHGKFPGANPCSIERRDFDTLRGTGEWYVCEKTDGVRALLVCLTFRGEKVVALITRGWDAYVLPLARVPRALFQGTVLDGELVRDDAARWTWLCFDAAFVSGVPVWSLGFADRIGAARRGLKAYSPDPEDPCDVRVKTFFAPSQASELVEHMKTLRYPVDGTIFTPGPDPVVVGRHHRMFKLKTKHTVDFVFTPPNVLSVFDPGTKAHVAVAKMRKATAVLEPAKGGIVECAPTTSAQWWTLVCVRTDKSTANDMLTFTKTKVNIREQLRFEEVMSVFV
jgi:mRNA guanylyltransferase